MAKLTLSKIKVRKDGEEAPKGTHVYLDVPGGTSPNKFDFQHFVVDETGRLAAKEGASLAKLDSTWRYWCLWSLKSDGALTMRKKKDWGTIKNFGFPLPARIVKKQLILPNTKTLTLRVFDLSGDDDENLKDIEGVHDSAIRFYKRLHIHLAIDFQSRPKDWPNLYCALHKATDKQGSIFDIKTDKPRMPPLRKGPWPPTENKTRTVIIIWVRHLIGTDAAVAWAIYRLKGRPGGHFTMGPDLVLQKQTDNAVVAIGARDNQRTQLDLAHEIGHCLLADVGVGTSMIDHLKVWKKAVKQRLKKLKMNEKEDVLYDSLPRGIHSPDDNNLMAPSKPGYDLTPLQVALMRTARELRTKRKPKRKPKPRPKRRASH